MDHDSKMILRNNIFNQKENKDMSNETKYMKKQIRRKKTLDDKLFGTRKLGDYELNQIDLEYLNRLSTEDYINSFLDQYTEFIDRCYSDRRKLKIHLKNKLYEVVHVRLLDFLKNITQIQQVLHFQNFLSKLFQFQLSDAFEDDTKKYLLNNPSLSGLYKMILFQLENHTWESDLFSTIFLKFLGKVAFSNNNFDSIFSSTQIITFISNLELLSNQYGLCKFFECFIINSQYVQRDHLLIIWDISTRIIWKELLIAAPIGLIVLCIKCEGLKFNSEHYLNDFLKLDLFPRFLSIIKNPKFSEHKYELQYINRYLFEVIRLIYSKGSSYFEHIIELVFKYLYDFMETRKNDFELYSNFLETLVFILDESIDIYTHLFNTSIVFNIICDAFLLKNKQQSLEVKIITMICSSQKFLDSEHFDGFKNRYLKFTLDIFEDVIKAAKNGENIYDTLSNVIESLISLISKLGNNIKNELKKRDFPNKLNFDSKNRSINESILELRDKIQEGLIEI